uniref:Uncharacterized protein n=1 Tax=Syphacia muris TaxID=451379 RepID=A0A0N5AQ87_9BILA
MEEGRKNWCWKKGRMQEELLDYDVMDRFEILCEVVNGAMSGRRRAARHLRFECILQPSVCIDFDEGTLQFNDDD